MSGCVDQITQFSLWAEVGEIILRRVTTQLHRLSRVTTAASVSAIAVSIRRTDSFTGEAEARICSCISMSQRLPWLEKNQHRSAYQDSSQDYEHAQRLEPAEPSGSPTEVSLGLLPRGAGARGGRLLQAPRGHIGLLCFLMAAPLFTDEPDAVQDRTGLLGLLVEDVIAREHQL